MKSNTRKAEMGSFKSIIYIAVLFLAGGCTKEIAGQTKSDTVGSAGDTTEIVNLYIFAGQSNCGRPQFPGKGLTGPAATAEQLAIYDSAITGFQIYNPIYDSLAFHNLQVGVNTMLINYNSTTEMGAEVSLLKALKDSTNLKEAYLIKCGYGNTNLAEWWLDTGKWNLYRYTDKAIRILEKQNKIPVLKGFIWMQGENDATDSIWAVNYQTNLQAFFSQFDAFYTGEASTLGLAAPDYIKVIGRINGSQDRSEIYRDIVRTNEEAFCAATANSFLINTDNYPLFGGVHYTITGQIQFGLDIYQALK